MPEIVIFYDNYRHFYSTLMSHYFHITPDVVGRHDNLEKGVIIFEFARKVASRPSRLASHTRFSTSALLSYLVITL